MTPKEIAKAIKAKGLQKLRWYCQMCQKQCRDENGFKQHCTSDSHQRMMKVFAENPNSFLDDFSKEFEDTFMDLVRRRWRTKRVAANKVYNEYIQDRHHTHMNATKWVTLGEFVAHLGRSALCEVEETEKGWFIKYIDRDPEMMKLQEAIKKKEKMDNSDDMRNQKRIEAQLAALEQLKTHGDIAVEADIPEAVTETEDGSAAPKAPEGPIKISLATFKKPLVTPSAIATTTTAEETSNGFDKKRKRDDSDDHSAQANHPNTSASPSSWSSTAPEAKRQKLSAIEEIRLQQEAKKERENRKDYWLFEGIIVKILNKRVLDGQLYKRKAVITAVEEKYLAVVKVLDSGHKLKIDQADLETVIPNKGGRVLIVNGAYRGEEAVLVDILVEQFKATVRIDKGPNLGTCIQKPYEDICKLVTSDDQLQ